jgi:hypothetical protein
MLEALENRCLPSAVHLTVTSLADSGPGTLRAAIETADAGTSADKFTIGFASGLTGTIDLQNALPDLKRSIEIQGPGASSLTVEPAVGVSLTAPIFTVDFAQVVTLSGLTIANGNDGGILNLEGRLTVEGSSISGNSADFGAGIRNDFGLLTVEDSSISGNFTTTFSSFHNLGGGIWNNYTATVSNSTLENNSAGEGGGIVNYGPFSTLTVSNCTVWGNSANAGGGIFADNGTLTVSNSSLDRNFAVRDGGGIANGGTLTVSDSTMDGNSTDGIGGAIVNSETFLTVINSTLTGNSAVEGAGIYNAFFGTLDVRGCKFSANTASDSGGGVYNAGAATFQDCTLSGNTAGSAGGGLFNAASGTVTAEDSTFLENVAPLGADIYNLGALTLNDCTVGVIGP